MLTDKPLRVVVVEDSEAFLLRLRAALSDLPVKVVGSAVNSSDAIAVIDRTHPDLVLLDVFLRAAAVSTFCGILKKAGQRFARSL